MGVKYKFFSVFLNEVIEEHKSNVKTKQLWENLTAQKENPTEIVRINWIALVLYENALYRDAQLFMFIATNTTPCVVPSRTRKKVTKIPFSSICTEIKI